MFVCFKGFMVDVEVWAGCMSSLTQLVCTPATPLLHELGASAAGMYNRHPLHTIAKYKFCLLREGWGWQRAQ
jgi:hypothetical protein